MDYELIIIGSGPGGYHAAIRAGQLGLRTAVVEKDALGGVCLNTGCIPTKALLHVAHDLREAAAATAFGIDFGTPDVDLERLASWKASVVKKMTGGVGQLLKGNKVDVIEGTARFEGPHELTVGDRTVTFDKAIVATGSRSITIPGFEPDGDAVVDSTGALDVPEIPGRFMAIGGSAIGLEFADVYHALGAETTVVEMMDELVPTADAEVAKVLRKSFEARGVDVRTSSKAVQQERKDDGIHVTIEASDGTRDTVVVDKLLVAIGRRPNAEELGLEEIGVRLDDKGYVQVNDHMQSTLPHVYAIGDVARPPLLAHKAMKEGLVAAEHAAGQPAAYDTLVPSVIYTGPELAAVGMTEAEAEEAGYQVRVGRFPLSASGRATTLGVSEGIVKLVGDAETDVLLGAHIVGPGAGDLIAEAVVAMEMGATLEDVALSQHPHPTLSEAVMEAAEHAHGRAIHIANKRR
ncbi:MAG: dihydrolipoyl dehydrogenase [Trueperaceae bacterium]|nr:dihydrolipoyl dehydrogenase [Trueperaceae bacterium]